MNATNFFLERYHGFLEYPVALLRDLNEEQARNPPHEGLNPVAWIMWHIARCEDLGINRLASDGEQVFDDGWSGRLGLENRSIGTGMTTEEVRELSASVDLEYVVEYRNAVSVRTEEVVGRMYDSDWQERLDAAHLHQVMYDEGGGGHRPELLVGLYNLQTKGWLVGHLALTHNFFHMGQVAGQRTMFGLPNPW